MTLNDFIREVDDLVSQWNFPHSATPRAELEVIYDKIRESAAHGLAEAIRLQGEAMEQLHEYHLKGKWEKKERR